MKDQIPQQYTGGKLDTTALVRFPDDTQAADFYEIAKQRLLMVSQWWEICEVPLSTFTLTDLSGKTLTRSAQIGDYIKINIPGPGTSAGEGYDWVVIEEIAEETSEDQKILSLRARPCANPVNSTDQTAHFFEPSASSTFQVRLQGKVVSAEEHGRNEVPNVHTENTLDNIRNTLVGWTAKLGLSYPQWKSLVKGLVKTA